MVKANELCCIYKSDLEKNEFINELLHFRSYKITRFNEKKITILLLLLLAMAELHINKEVISHGPRHKRGLERFNLDNYKH
jgi:hypothetical protein